MRTDDDQGVAAVVGFVLILAAAITYYSYAAQNEVPRVGARNERGWDAEVGAALVRLATAAGEAAGTQAAAAETLPGAPDAPTQTVPLLRPLRSAAATGSVAYSPDCGGATLTHLAGAVPVSDLTDGAHGCMTFLGETSYAEPFAYRIELGGVLRLQGDKAVVLGGPPLLIEDGTVALTLVDLAGTSQSLGVDRASTPVTFTPKPGALEVGAAPNAAAATWTLTTDYPEAWTRWYQERFDAEGMALSTSAPTCADPSATGPARGPCTVVLDLPAVTSLSISYGRYDVSLG